MLRFRLHQLFVSSLERYFLPLPKLSDARLTLLASHLAGCGFKVRPTGGPGKLAATKGGQRIAIDGALGLAGSGTDMLDALAPGIPAILTSKGGVRTARTADPAEQYFSLKRSRGSVQLQFFPRLESLRIWTCLRRDRMRGLTPDEAAVVRHLLGNAPSRSRVECVTEIPSQGSRPIQIGKHLYYRSAIPVAEFLSSLATIDSDASSSACYLPRGSLMLVPGSIDAHVPPEELGEWCLLD